MRFELRQLGIAVVGGLIVSQALTLFTTPVTYLYMDGFSHWLGRRLRGTEVVPIEAVAPRRKAA